MMTITARKLNSKIPKKNYLLATTDDFIEVKYTIHIILCEKHF